MTGYSVSHGAQRIAAGEYDQVWVPRSPRAGRCGVVLVHGSGSPQGFIDSVAQPSSVILAAALAGAGVPCVAGDMGGQAWGNDTVVSRIDAAWNVLKAQVPSMRTDKVCLLGASMGGAAVARYSQTYPAKVAAVVGLIPLWDVMSFYAGQTTAVRAEVAAAWGVAAGASLPSGADFATVTNASKAAGIPHLAGYSSVDNIVLPAWVTSYTTKVGGTALVTDSTYGHSDQAIAGMPVATVGKFLSDNGA